MSKYYKADDIDREIERLLRFSSRNDFDLGTKHGIETVERVLKDLPTIEADEDCISREWVLEEFSKGREMLYKPEYFDELIWLVIHAPSIVPKERMEE